MRYRVGDLVSVAAGDHPGHHRAPAYLKGKRGTVERIHGSFANPETKAYGGDGLPKQRLYLIGFDQIDVWPSYGGDARDRIYADVYEHWLEER